MCQNENEECNRKAKYVCRLCGLEYCQECAEDIDGFCDCESDPNLVLIDSNTKEMAHG